MFYWLCYFCWEITQQLGENVGHGSSAQAAFLTEGKKKRRQDLKDSIFVRGAFSLCLYWGRKAGRVVGDKQNEVSNSEKCQKNTEVS